MGSLLFFQVSRFVQDGNSCPSTCRELVGQECPTYGNCLKTPLSLGRGVGGEGTFVFFACCLLCHRLTPSTFGLGFPLTRPSATLSLGRGFENRLGADFEQNVTQVCHAFQRQSTLRHRFERRQRTDGGGGCLCQRVVFEKFADVLDREGFQKLQVILHGAILLAIHPVPAE